MLSNQTSNSYIQHRRTNSTPTPRHVAPNVPILPADPAPQQGNHRRGLTLDQSSDGLSPLQQNNGPIYTNQGPQAQYTIRETQQHAMARPGQNTAQVPRNLKDKEQCQFLTTSSSIIPTFEQSTSETSSYSTYTNQSENQQQCRHESRIDMPPLREQAPLSRHLEGFDDEINRYIRDVENNEAKTILSSGNMSKSRSPIAISEDIKRPFTPPSQSSTSKFRSKCSNSKSLTLYRLLSTYAGYDAIHQGIRST